MSLESATTGLSDVTSSTNNNINIVNLKNHTASIISSSSPPSSFMLAVPPTPSPSQISQLSNSNPPAGHPDRGCSMTSSSSVNNIQTPGSVLTAHNSLPKSSQIPLTPSTDISHSLTTLASQTSSILYQVWNEVGYTLEERTGQIEELVQDIQRLCEAKIAEERGVAKEFQNVISDLKKEMVILGRALHVDVDPGVMENQSLPLMDEVTHIEAEIENLRHRAATAKTQLQTHLTKLQTLHKALGSQIPSNFIDIESDLTEERQSCFRTEVEKTEAAVNNRTSSVVQLLLDCKTEYRELRMEEDNLLTTLDVKIMQSLVENEQGHLTIRSYEESENCTGISTKMIHLLSNRKEEVMSEIKKRKVALGNMGQEIGYLWEQLKVTPDEQRIFTESILQSGLGMGTMRNGRAELERLHKLKAEMIGKLIQEARQSILALWEETNADPDQETQKFREFQINDESKFDDDLLSSHEGYITALTEKLNIMRPMLEKISKREAILKERMEYEELQKDPERLQQRGASLTKQLLKEEKMSRRIKKDLPKYTEMLTQKLYDWEESMGEPFLVKGEVYLEVMNKQEEDWLNYKDTEMQAKLRKKQEQQETFESKMITGGIQYRPLPGRKKNIAVRNPSRPRPREDNAPRNPSRPRALADLRSRENGDRASSRSKPRDGQKMGEKTRAVRSTSNLRSASNSRGLLEVRRGTANTQ